VELGFPVFGCASTGNLANSVSAHAARLGLPCYVFIPNDLEPNKVLGSAVYGPQIVAVDGNYDDVNRLCTQIADRYGWGFANINLRSYYAEGAKTMGFEVAEQLGWRYPDHLVSPVAGGTLLPRIFKGLRSSATSVSSTAACRGFMRRSPRDPRPSFGRSNRALNSRTRETEHHCQVACDWQSG
jgi:threonine synthase